MENKIVLITFIALICGLGYITGCHASSVVENYYIEQDSITVSIDSKSELPQVFCKFFNEENKVINQGMNTVVETFDNVTIIESAMYHDQHVNVAKVECE